MPELPEVQIVVNGLNQYVSGKTVDSVNLLWSQYLDNAGEKQLQQAILDQKIGEAARLGKYIFLEVGDYVLQIHLRMTGVLRVKHRGDERGKHVHLQFQFSDGTRLDFSDTRKFGRVLLLKKSRLGEHKASLELGPDPLLDHFDGAVLAGIAGDRRKNIKSILMDQKLIAGIGNIYAVEALYLAGIRPDRPGEELSLSECESIALQVRELLKRAISRGGTSTNDYMQVSGVRGDMQNHLLVYNQDGGECPRCGDTIIKEQIGGRGTFYCPGCQH